MLNKLTNQYSLTKTLRFELKPTIETLSLLQHKNLNGLTPIEADQEIANLYKSEMKPMLDKLHRKFINDSLSIKNIFNQQDLETHYSLIKELKLKDQINGTNEEETSKEKLEESSKKLRENLVKTFNETSKIWTKYYSQKGVKIKDIKKPHEILTREHTLNILLIEFPEKAEIINKFKGFWTYFSGFNKTRENFYSSENKTTAISNRIINENLSRYIDNIFNFEKCLESIPDLSIHTKDLEILAYSQYINQTGIDNYNKLIGGYVDKNGKKVQGLNELINLFRQKHKVKLPNLKHLFNQIGSEKEAFDFINIQEGDEWLKLKEFISLTHEESFIDLKHTYDKFFASLKTQTEEYDLNLIYLNKISINTISSSWFIDWRSFADLLNIKMDRKLNEPKIPEQLTLAQIKESLQSRIYDKEYSASFDGIFKTTYKEKNLFVKNAWITFINIWQYEVDNTFNNLKQLIDQLESNSKNPIKKGDDKRYKDQLAYIKDICDTILAIQRMAKYFIPKNNYLSRDEELYKTIEAITTNKNINEYYNAFRNHLTKKPYSEDKIKLNFENGNLLGGWSDGQERNKCGVLLKNGDNYYLGILIDRSIFRTDKKSNQIYNTKNLEWERLILTNLKFQTLAGKGFLGHYGVSYGQAEPTKSMEMLQSFIKSNYIAKYPQLEAIINNNFNNKKDFDAKIKETLNECFTMKFIPINQKYLMEVINEGSLLLFKISNKDFASGKHGKDNVETLYWKQLFSEENLSKVSMGLNGGAEVFFRKGQREKLAMKMDKKGKEILESKRYAEDKYFFHVPITINYGKQKKVKQDVYTDYIKNNDINILGIDRGEKHLMYYSLINSTGEIIEQGSFNKIRMGNKDIDFNEKLEIRSAEMKNARQNWEQIGNIKNFKEGYLSQVVHEICKLMVKHNAVVVMEDLNSEFKAKRTAKVEKSVYKKFELALAKKLNHLILKDKEAQEPGGVLNAYQLTPPIDKIDIFERSKRWGLIFYVRANYTSQTDPVTGWRKSIYIQKGDEESIKNQILEKFTDFGFDGEDYYFKYADANKKEWTMYSSTNGISLDRYYSQKENNHWIIRKYDINENLNKIFVEFDHTKSFKKQLEQDLVKLKKIDNQTAWESLRFAIDRIQQIRNTGNNEKDHIDNDFLLSPVKSKNNEHFDSRKVKTDKLPVNGDANGAFNIARKGLVMIDHIKKDLDVFISDAEWDAWLAGINIWESWLSQNSQNSEKKKRKRNV